MDPSWEIDTYWHDIEFRVFLVRILIHPNTIEILFEVLCTEAAEAVGFWPWKLQKFILETVGD